jgi:[acyl-carrier-protein] S-malonyltransferase
VGKIAFLYPGQGSQKAGMGKDLLESAPELYDRYLDAADAAAALEIRKLSLEGPQDALTETDVAQPALFALSLALTEVARGLGLRPDFVAGHSLGEYTAAVSAGALSFEDGMRAVSLRGRLMAEAQSVRPGTMAAVLGLESDALEGLCSQASGEAGLVSPANFNTPTQIVVSGEEAGVVRLMELAEEAGAERVIRLQVGAAFHSELMKPAQERMGEELDAISWSDPEVPMAANAFGTLVDSAGDVRKALFTQIASPVRWVDCVHALPGAGVTTFLEVGPGRVLGGLVKQILGMDADVSSVDSPKKLETFLSSRTETAAS